MTQRRFGLSLPVFVFMVVVTLLASQSFAASTFYTCTSTEVATYPERIHVRCSVAASGGIVFFAVPTANSAHAARMLTVLMMAHLTAKPIIIEYDPADTSGTSFGCGASDCRRFLSLAVR